jgi:hypothetical protein
MSLSLPGTVDGINLTTVTATKNRAALTGMAWINAVLWSSTTNQKIFGYSTGASPTLSRFTMISRSAAPGQLQVGGRALDADSQRTLNSTTTISTGGTWHHVVGIVDYTNTLGWIYIDGELDVSGPLSGALGATTTENTNSLSAGWGVREGSSAGGSQGMTGLIEDCRLYNGVVGPKVIKAIFTAQGRDGVFTNLLHRYMCKELAIGRAVVAVPNLANFEHLTGAPIGSPTYGDGIATERRRRRWLAPPRI